MPDKSAGASAAPGKPVPASTEKRDLLRHTVATLAYRGGKAVRGAPPDFGHFQAGPRGWSGVGTRDLEERTGGDPPGGTPRGVEGKRSRTALEVLAHIGDLLDWSLSLAKGEEVWRPVPPCDWDHDVRRFSEALQRLDAYLASDRPLGCSCEQLLQGPLADALTHVGQIAMLRRLAGSPILGENYRLADISAGRVGLEQSPPRREFE